jgi:hypothetical protein
LYYAKLHKEECNILRMNVEHKHYHGDSYFIESCSQISAGLKNLLT